jgi:hypothetical protein
MWPKTLRYTRVMLGSALISLLICVETLLFAGLSLANQHDISPPVVQGILSSVALLLLLPQLADEAWIRGLNFFDDEVTKARVLLERESDPTFLNVAQS